MCHALVTLSTLDYAIFLSFWLLLLSSLSVSLSLDLACEVMIIRLPLRWLVSWLV